jgi:hypothetical protein
MHLLEAGLSNNKDVPQDTPEFISKGVFQLRVYNIWYC